MTETPDATVEPTPTPAIEAVVDTVEVTPPATPSTKAARPKKDACSDLRAAAELALKHYRKTHTMETPDDFKYPGFKELYKALDS